MAQFQFAYNIGDIVTFICGSGPEGQVLKQRGTINSIIIAENEALYMIGARYAVYPVTESDILCPIFSTKSFEVFYPGVEVIATLKDHGKEIDAYVESAVISEGRLRYWLSTMDGINAFQVEESCVRLAHNKQANIDKFQ